MIPRRKKECKECGEKRYIFSHGLCEYCYRKNRVHAETSKSIHKIVSERPNKAVEPIKGKSGRTIPLRTKKRISQEKSYSRIIKEMDNREDIQCIFCGGYMDSPEDHHHLAGRIGDLLTNQKYIAHAHLVCHHMYHNYSVDKIRWFTSFIARLGEIDRHLSFKEVLKLNK